MKHVQFWLSEEEYESLKREAERKGVTPYTLVKQLVLKRRRMLLFGYLLMVYAAGCTAVLIYLILSLFTL